MASLKCLTGSMYVILCMCFFKDLNYHPNLIPKQKQTKGLKKYLGKSTGGGKPSGTFLNMYSQPLLLRFMLELYLISKNVFFSILFCINRSSVANPTTDVFIT